MNKLPVEYKPNIKKKTKTGKAVSHFTLLAKFYPNKKYKNPEFTYRGDVIMRELNSLFKNQFKNQMSALLYKARLIKMDAFEMILYDNSMPQPYSVIKKWHEGSEIFDITADYKLDEKGNLYRSITHVDEN